MVGLQCYVLSHLVMAPRPCQSLEPQNCGADADTQLEDCEDDQQDVHHREQPLMANTEKSLCSTLVKHYIMTLIHLSILYCSFYNAFLTLSQVQGTEVVYI